MEVRDPLRLHDVLDGVRVLNEGDDAHLSFTLGALERIHLVESLYARGPTTPTKLAPIVALVFLHGRRGELSALASAPTGIPSIIPGQRLVGFRNMG